MASTTINESGKQFHWLFFPVTSLAVLPHSTPCASAQGRAPNSQCSLDMTQHSRAAVLCQANTGAKNGPSNATAALGLGSKEKMLFSRIQVWERGSVQKKYVSPLGSVHLHAMCLLAGVGSLQ